MNGNDFNAYYFSHARTALKYGLISLNIREGSEIFIPDYICDVVLHPIEQLKLKPIFYPTFEDLTPEWDFLKNQMFEIKTHKGVLNEKLFYRFLYSYVLDRKFIYFYGIKEPVPPGYYCKFHYSSQL